MTPVAGARRLPMLEDAVLAGLGRERARVLPFQPPASAVRLRRADARDAAALHALLDGYAAQGLLLSRTPERIRAMIPDFLVAEGEGRLLGCAALRLYGTGRGEVCALAVSPDAHGRGVGRRLVEALLAEGRALGLSRLFALTLQPGFFAALGFAPAHVAEFPEKQAADCAACARRTRCPEACLAHDLTSPMALPEA